MMTNVFVRIGLARANARRLASEVLAEIELTPVDFADMALTAEERLEVYAELRRISARVLHAPTAMASAPTDTT